ncbi:MBL fold metallo-hydrolase [Clostridium zeae]|uniref:MBL fold metallo-hydrolase n=1 Tax=Clostridium zeae TaxID=2759022 RepID=A0ABQ1EF77_9CLOT|nr:MBL fold metallo-hydrolase [Clostridium zeae]GFZ33240.1 MBL fold metallo-hydrolase [Clostridium zeae]
MKDWFTIEKIDNSTYVISEEGHWEKMHSYLLIGETSALLIDTGLGIGNIRAEVELLTDLPVKVVTTHVHWDHIGGHGLFNDISVYVSEAQWLEKGIPMPINVIKNNVIKEPFSKMPPKEFDINKYKVYTGTPTKLLFDNDIIDIGCRKIRVLHTPGHSPGHICLFEEDRGYLYTGDLIYLGTLFAFYPSTNPVDFKKSVDRLSKLHNIQKILPGHNALEVPVDTIEKVKEAFEYIEKNNLLKHGSGIFEFESFSIHL